MKINKFILMVLATIAMPFMAQAASDCNGYMTSNCQKHGGSAWVVGGTQAVRTGGSLTVESGGSLVFQGATDTSGMAFSTTLTGNPLMQLRVVSINAASADADSDLATSGLVLTSASGKAIIPSGGLTIMASGTAAGATSVSLKCSSGRIIATIPVSLLVDAIPAGIFSSSSALATTRGAGLTRGCSLGESVYLSATGAGLTTVTHFFVSVPYTVSTTAP